MSISHLIARPLAALAATFLMATSSQAAVIASFDPAFGNSIPNLGFRGTITLDLSAGCPGATFTGYLYTGSGCDITPIAANVDFYNSTKHPVPSVSDILLTMYPSFPFGYVYAAHFTAGQLDGFDTYDSNRFFFSLNDPDTDPSLVDNGIDYDGSMVLYFQSGIASAITAASRFGAAAAADPQQGTPGAYLRDCTGSDGREDACLGTSSNLGALTFRTVPDVTAVPEPDELALGALGLVALALARRRKAIAR